MELLTVICFAIQIGSIILIIWLGEIIWTTPPTRTVERRIELFLKFIKEGEFERAKRILQNEGFTGRDIMISRAKKEKILPSGW